MGLVDGSAALGDPHVALAGERRDPAEQVDAAVALVFRIHPLDSTWFRIYGHQHIADELARFLVEADHWALGVKGAVVNIQHIF